MVWNKSMYRYFFIIITLSALFHSCEKETDDPDPVTPTQVFKICIDENGTKWAATTEGLLVFKNSGWQTVDNSHVSEKSVKDIAF